MGWARQQWSGGGEGGMGPTGQEGEPPTHNSTSGLEGAMAEIHVQFCVLSLKAFWHVVGAAGAYQVRKDFWKCLVASGGREARCWMQKAVFIVWSLEHGIWGLSHPPAPPHISCWICSKPSAHLPLSLPPSWRQRQPCQLPWQLCPSGNSDIWSARGSADIFLLSATGLRCVGLDSLHSGSFLRSRPAAELLSVSPPSNHRARISPSPSAMCNTGPHRGQFIWFSRGPDKVSRDDGLSLSPASWH